jgi:hypothetical protein
MDFTGAIDVAVSYSFLIPIALAMEPLVKVGELKIAE